MNHFLKKNLSIRGAGFGKKGGGGGPPPPAELQPPKLGKLQTLSSYSYAEIIDLVSDGPIDGIVNQNGQYLQGHRIFEGIYFDNTPVKKSFDINYTGENTITAYSYDISSDASGISGLWYRGNAFLGTDFTGVRSSLATGSLTGNLISGRSPAMIKQNSYFADHTPVNDPYLSLSYVPISHTGNSGNMFSCPDPYIREKHWEMTWTRNDIAKSIYKSVDLLKKVASEPLSYGEQASDMAKNKILRYNYQNWTDIRDALLPFPINQSEDDYPIFAVKFEVGSPFVETVVSECGNPLSYFQANEKQLTVSSDFTVDKYTNIVFSDDIANQTFQKIELENLKLDHIVQPIGLLDLTYAQKTTSTNVDVGGSFILFGFKNGQNAPSQESIDAIKRFVNSYSVVRSNDEKYNYNNVLSEIRNGDELQAPLSYFSKVYVDREYGIKLVGPFDVSNQILRVTNFDDDSGFQINGTSEFPLGETVSNEGSSDTRNSKDFSSYVGNNRTQYIEEAIPITHVIENPNVDQLFISLGVRALNDTNQIDSTLNGIGSVQAGTRIPTAVRFKLEFGLQNSYGQDVAGSVEERVYQIMGLVDSPAIVDIGRSEVSTVLSNYKFLNGSSNNSEINASTAIILPEATQDSKRFVRLTRTTYETSSSLVRREISLEKVTEIINTKFSYPSSAIIGTKIDSRTLSAIPPRSFDLRLKRILVPSNYYPLFPDGKDKRRYKTASEFSNATADDLQIYRGNWDGTFKLSWSDNPAWVLFDMLINTRYGLGSFIDQSQVNIWELYKIGRFCDAVDKNGVFQGVDNGLGGKEPRYSINIILADKSNVFETINAIASVFRGNIFYTNSLIDFADDRLKLPVLEFNNSNVKDGTFSYTNSRKDQEFNVIEVSYLDESDNFKPKIEYVENSDDIRKRGILSSTIDSFGVTSKSLANRIGKHVLYATTKENQAVSFIGGIESLMLKPGDLISINDELKTQQRNFGRVLDLDEDSGRVYINEKFLSSACLNEVTLMAPTGTKSYGDLLGIARQSGGISFRELYEGDVPQIQTFKISSYDNSPDYGSYLYIGNKIEYPFVVFTGVSGVSGTGFYSGNGVSGDNGFYTGITDSNYSIYKEMVTTPYPAVPAEPPPDLLLTFGSVETGSIEFLFNGTGYQFDFISGGTSPYYSVDVASFSTTDEMAAGLVAGMEAQIDGISLSSAGSVTTITNAFAGATEESSVTSIGLSNATWDGGGFGIDEIPSGESTSRSPFWSLRNTTVGTTLYRGASGEAFPYNGVWNTGGCYYRPQFDNPNRDFLSRVKQGSIFGVTLSGVEKEVYKVNSIRESNINEYEISASKFDTGKFAEIESSQNLNDFYETFSFIPSSFYNPPTTVESQVYQLESPVIQAFETGNYDGANDSLDVSGSWASVVGASSYLVNLISPNGTKTTVDTTGQSYIFDDQTQLGFYRLLVSAKNPSFGYSSKTSSSGIYVFATETYITPYIKNITIN